MAQLEKRLEKIRTEGLENYRKRYYELTNLLREGLKEFGFEVLAQNPASCVTGIMTHDLDASKIVEIMREKYNIEIAPSGGELKNKLFRVGNFGNITKKDIKRFLKAMKKTLKELRNDRK